MDARLLIICFLVPVADPSYLTYDLETECPNGSVTFHLSDWGAKSAAILKATSHTSFKLQMHCKARLEAPQGYAVMISLREIGFRTYIDGSCKDYLQIQNRRPMCEKIFRKDEERHFDSLSNNPSNVIDILYHTGDGLNNKTFSGYPGFTFTFTAFAKGPRVNQSAFECTNENLIWPGLTCDGHNNCGDLSDEDPYGDANCGETTSGCFYPRSNHWEKLEEGRSVTSVAAEFGIAHSIVSRLWRQFQTTGTAIRGFSSGRPRGTTPADDRYIVLQARRNRRQTAGEIARHTTQATGRPISRFTMARRLHGGGLFARRPVRCVPLTPAHRRRRSLWCREHRNWRDNEWGRVLFTDESRFSLSSDSHRILIWREREAAIIPRTSLKGTGMEVAVFSFGEASCLVVVQTFTSSTQVQSTGPVIVTRFFFHMCVF
ncbi:uncharacterized protein TNCV_4273312 [Trichonephila clavipes]|nr:uncharacterized protein TNCV_4273312 [Trichonephila clavipes]